MITTVTTIPITFLSAYDIESFILERPDPGFGLLQLDSWIFWRTSAVLWVIGLLVTVIAMVAAILFNLPKLQRIVYGMLVGVVIGLVSLLTTCSAFY